MCRVTVRLCGCYEYLYEPVALFAGHAFKLSAVLNDCFNDHPGVSAFLGALPFFQAREGPSIMEGMPCEERERIIKLLSQAVTAYRDAVQATSGLRGKSLERSLRLIESTQETYENCRQILMAHERSHGCAPNPEKAPSS